MAAITTPVQVANLALGLVGVRQFIGAFTDQSVEAEVAALYFDTTRDEVLQMWHWRFATKRVSLALALDAAGVAVARDGWGFCYVAPADMLVAQQVWSGKREPGDGQTVPFTKELNDAGTGQLILTDMQSAKLHYTARLVTVALWPPLFVKAVAAQLAVYMAPALPVKLEAVALLERRAAVALQVAAARDGNETERDDVADSEFIRVRA